MALAATQNYCVDYVRRGCCRRIGRRAPYGTAVISQERKLLESRDLPSVPAPTGRQSSRARLKVTPLRGSCVGPSAGLRANAPG
jgi:hypothetical protein